MTKDLSAVLITLFLSLCAPITAADMLIDNSIIYFEPGKPHRQDITVRNTGKSPLYIKVTSSVVHAPGTDQQSRKKAINPKQSGLLVSPNKLVVPPGGRKLIRFVNLQPSRDREGVYRVVIEPVVGKIQAQENAVKVMIGYEILVLAQPKTSKPNLTAQRNGKTLTLSNDGNVNIYLFRGKQCPQNNSENEQCTTLRDKRLYPGNQWQLSLAEDAPVQFQLATGSTNSLRVIP